MDQTPTASNSERSRQRLLNEEAAAWLLTLENEPGEDTEARFREWLEKSADHMQVFLEIAAIDRDLEGLDFKREIDLAALVATVRQEGAPNVVELSKHAVKPDAAATTAARNSRLRIAAAVVGLALLSGVFFWIRQTGAERYVTTLGEQRAVKLDDGSLVHLNTLTRLDVNFTTDTRDVRLLDGEALFIVERDSRRPFRVLTGSTVVQAVGTQFNVYRHAGSTTVSVIEGRVKVSEGADPVVLNAGESARVQSGGRVAKQSAVSVDKAVYWRRRELSFDHDTLGDVAAEFNRYNRIQIRIADPEVSRREIEGVFNADEPQALLDFLALDPGLRLERSADTVSIYLRPD